MRKRYLLFSVCSALAAFAVAAQKSGDEFPLKIGLLADSQITSQNGLSDVHYRSKDADALVDVSIRPPALECFLAPEMLQIALNKLTQDPGGSKRGVDVILYLGDAANSGGADEIDTVLRILAKHREQTGIPIFVIIGNHDYLGAGNIVTPGIRFAILNRLGRPDNPPLTKYEVLKRFSGFNHGNNRLPANTCFRYTDNAEALEKNKALDHDTGLYLAGILTYREASKATVDVFLLDSSDYIDSPDWSEVAGLGFYGVIGAVSFKDKPGFVSQISYLNTFFKSSSPHYRFLASHYPKDHLDRITFAKPGQVPLDVTNIIWSATEQAFSIPTFSKTLNQNLATLIIPGERNYWVSGHTHVKTTPRPDRFIVGGLMGEKYFRALNVGSTTDYCAHVLIVERYIKDSNKKLDECIGYRKVPLFEGNPVLLASLPKAIAEYGRSHVDDPDIGELIPSLEEWKNEKKPDIVEGVGSAIFGILGNKETDMTEEDSYWIDVGATILGLNKEYQEDAWKDPQTEAATRHIKAFTEQFITDTSSNRAQTLAFLGLLAGVYENGLFTEGCDLNPKNLEKLAQDPK